MRTTGSYRTGCGACVNGAAPQPCAHPPRTFLLSRAVVPHVLEPDTTRAAQVLQWPRMASRTRLQSTARTTGTPIPAPISTAS